MARAASNSIFSYSLTRPYPYRWFTPVAIIGGIVSLGLVSFLNVAASGYELIATNSVHRNATISNSVWFDSWPEWLASTRASCESATIPLQTGLYTNNTAFFYTLIAAWRYSPPTSAREEDKVNLGSLLYDENELERCNISTLKVQIEGGSGLRDAGQVGVQQFGAAVTANVNCVVMKEEGPTYVTFVTTYDPIPPPDLPSSGFVGMNSTHKASLHWGQSVMRLYWSYMLMKFYEENYLRDPPAVKAEITLKRDTSKNTTVQDEKEVDFMSAAACWLLHPNATGIHHSFGWCDNNTISVLAVGGGKVKPVPSVWLPLGVLGKAMWFTVLADLGRDDEFMPNMLASPESLEYLTANLSVVNASLPDGADGWRWGLVNPSNSRVPYLAQKDGTTQLGVSASVLATSYICQTPKLKNTGTLIVSVLVADLVLLQAIWKVYTMVLDYFVVSKSQNGNHCEGCVGILKSDVPLQDIDAADEEDRQRPPASSISSRASLLAR